MPFRSFDLAVSESRSALPRRESVWRTPSAAFHDSDESELSYKAAANSKKPLARWTPELYLLMVMKTSRAHHDLQAADLSIVFFRPFVQRNHTFGAQVLSRDGNFKTLQMFGLILIRRGDGISLIAAHPAPIDTQLLRENLPGKRAATRHSQG